MNRYSCKASIKCNPAQMISYRVPGEPDKKSKDLRPSVVPAHVVVSESRPGCVSEYLIDYIISNSDEVD